MDNNNVVTAKVVYKDVNSNQIVNSKSIVGLANHVVSPNNYKKYIPNKYKFVSFGHFNQNLRANEVNVIYVKRATDSSDTKGSIMVDYINANNQLIGHNKFTSKIGNHFNINQCKATIPKNYKLNRILTGKDVNLFKSQSQIMVVQVKKIHFIKVLIKYLADDKIVGRANAKGALGTPFNIERYVKNIPKGYQLVKILDHFSRNFKQNREIRIKVAKKTLKSVKPANNSNDALHKDPKEIGDILMKLASSLHDLGMTISKSKQL